MAKWGKTTFPGVRYREHAERKNGVKRDQYFTVRYKLAGKDKEEGLGWASEGWTAAKAYQRLSELKTNQRAGEGPQTLGEKRGILADQKKEAEADRVRQEKEAISFDRFFTGTYLPQARSEKKPRSVEREEGLYSIWIRSALGDKPMRDIIPLHLERLKRDMAGKEQSPRSIEYALSVIRQVFNTAKRLGEFSGENPTQKVRFPKPDNSRMRFLTRDEADRLLSALKEKLPDVHDMTLLSLHAGLRFGEIASLTWQDVNLEKGTLTIRDAKAGSRYAFLTDQAIEMLKGRKKGNPADYVFPSRAKDDQGRKIKMERISVTFARTVDDLGLNKGIDDPRLQICFHSCRHSYASWMIEEGADLYTVQKLLGHKTGIMTQRYAHLSDDRLRDAARALGASWKDHAEAGQVVNFTK
jgi:integrase